MGFQKNMKYWAQTNNAEEYATKMLKDSKFSAYALQQIIACGAGYPEEMDFRLR